MILVVEPDAGFAAHIAERLRERGWQVVVAEDKASAMTRALETPPALALVDIGLPDARELLAAFSTKRGGPGSLALVPAAISEQVRPADYLADAIVPKPFSDQELLSRVAVHLDAAAANRTRPEPDTTDDTFSSVELFGDILAEVEGAGQPSPSPSPAHVDDRFDDDLERKLEQTLSGVLDSPPKRRSGQVAAPSPASEIDRMLEDTLGPLARPRRKRPAPPTPAPSATPPPVTPPPAPPVVPPAPDPLAAADALATVRMPVFSPAEGEPFGDYTLIERIAVGGMAEVWRARRSGVEGFRKTVAIKKILAHLTGIPDFVSMLIEEAKLAAQLNHANIIQIYDLGKVDDDFFIAMEYVDGLDLRSILTAARGRDVPLSIGQSLSIASHLARALDYAHRKRGFDGSELNLVHRDVSPQNVLISREGEIKLCDFGIARAVSKVSHTQMGTLKGKLQYMSPEQAWGRKVDARSDIFSLGTVLFEMLTGARLFAGDSEIKVLDAVRDCRIPPLDALRSEVPEEVAAIVRRALAKAPEDRYQSSGELERELAAALDDIKPMPTQSELAGLVQQLLAEPRPAAGGVEVEASLTPTAPPATPVPSAPPAPEARVEPPAGIAEPPAEASHEPSADTVPPATADAATGEEAYDVLGEDAPVRQPRRRGWWIAAAALILLVLGAVWVVLQLQGGRDGTAASDPASTGSAGAETPAVPAPLGEAEDSVPPAEAPALAPPETSEPLPVTESTATAESAVEGGESADADPAAEDIDLESLVSAEWERRASKLRQDFERERRRLEAELAKARESDEAEAAPPPPPPPESPPQSPPPPAPGG